MHGLHLVLVRGEYLIYSICACGIQKIRSQELELSSLPNDKHRFILIWERRGLYFEGCGNYLPKRQIKHWEGVLKLLVIFVVRYFLSSLR